MLEKAIILNNGLCYPPARGEKMAEKEDKDEVKTENKVKVIAEDEVVAFGMTDNQIDDTIEALSKYKDDNHPSKTGSYSDFLDVIDAGHNALLAQKNYGKINQ